jgi:predicted GIY-YIG superfamily endonuclease
MENIYSHGKIYQITSSNGLPYIGSTVQSLSHRLSSHKNRRNNSSVIHLDASDCKIEIIEHFPCRSRDELLWKEREYIESRDCCNKITPIRSRDEAKMLKSFHNGIKQMCRCGTVCSNRNMSRHRSSKNHLKWLRNEFSTIMCPSLELSVKN